MNKDKASNFEHFNNDIRKTFDENTEFAKEFANLNFDNEFSQSTFEQDLINLRKAKKKKTKN